MTVAANGRFSPPPRTVVQRCATMRWLVVQPLILLAVVASGCGGGAAPSSSSLLPTGRRTPGDVPADDAGAADLGAPSSPDVSTYDSAPAAPLPDAAPVQDFPTCAAIGYEAKSFQPCEMAGDDGRRTGDQRFTCVKCSVQTTGFNPPPQACVTPLNSGDRPTLCVPSCTECPIRVKCDNKPPPGVPTVGDGCWVVDGGV